MLVVKHDSILILHMWVTDSYVSYGSNLRRLDICYCKKIWIIRDNPVRKKSHSKFKL